MRRLARRGAVDGATDSRQESSLILTAGLEF